MTDMTMDCRRGSCTTRPQGRRQGRCDQSRKYVIGHDDGGSRPGSGIRSRRHHRHPDQDGAQPVPALRCSVPEGSGAQHRSEHHQRRPPGEVRRGDREPPQADPGPRHGERDRGCRRSCRARSRIATGRVFAEASRKWRHPSHTAHGRRDGPLPQRLSRPERDVAGSSARARAPQASRRMRTRSDDTTVAEGAAEAPAASDAPMAEASDAISRRERDPPAAATPAPETTTPAAVVGAAGFGIAGHTAGKPGFSRPHPERCRRATCRGTADGARSVSRSSGGRHRRAPLRARPRRHPAPPVAPTAVPVE